MRVKLPDAPAVRDQGVEVVPVPEPEHAHGGLVLVEGAVRDVDALSEVEGEADQAVGLDFRVREREVARERGGGAERRGRDEAVDDEARWRA